MARGTGVGEGPPSPPPAYVSLDRVSVTLGMKWGRVEALREVSLTAFSGSITVLEGPNGAGKTTLLDLLPGWLRPTRGRVLVGGSTPGEHRRERGVAYLPAVAALPPEWSAAELLGKGLDLLRLEGVARERARLSAFGIVDLPLRALSRPLSTLSTGSARRVAVAWALLGEPRLLVLDEPFTSLDRRSRQELGRVILEARRSGAVVFIASHDRTDSGDLCDRSVFLRDGRVEEVVEHGPSFSVGSSRDPVCALSIPRLGARREGA